MAVCMHVRLCILRDCSLLGSSVRGIFPSAGDLPDSGIEPRSPAGGFFTTEPPGNPNLSWLPPYKSLSLSLDFCLPLYLLKVHRILEKLPRSLGTYDHSSDGVKPQQHFRGLGF